MENIILWVVSAGFTLMLVMWQSLNKRLDHTDARIDKLDLKIDAVNASLSQKIEAGDSALNQKIEALNVSLSQKIEAGDSALSQKIEALNVSLCQKIEALESSFNRKIEKLDEKVTDIDRRICRLEGAFSARDCCILKDDSHQKKAE